MEGSSPLTRGKPGSDGKASCRWGLIPAHAGKTGRAGRRAGDGGAHPRSRGENVDELRERFEDAGLIPAHAGKTG